MSIRVVPPSFRSLFTNVSYIHREEALVVFLLEQSLKIAPGGRKEEKKNG